MKTLEKPQEWRMVVKKKRLMMEVFNEDEGFMLKINFRLLLLKKIGWRDA
jgi:hypothetical protein